MRRRSATLTTLTMALGAVFLFGCQDQGPTQATLDDIPPDFTPGFAKGGKGGGGGGGLDVSVAGGTGDSDGNDVIAASQPVSVKSDNRKTLTVEATGYALEWNLEEGVDIPLGFVFSPENPAVEECNMTQPDLTGLDPSVTAAGIAALLKKNFTAAMDGDFKFRVSKGELGVRSGYLSTPRPMKPLLDSNGLLRSDTSPGHVNWQAPIMTLVSGDINDPGSTRVFRLTGGRVNTGGHLSTTSEAPPRTLIGLTCDMIDADVIVTVSPAAP